MTRKDNRQESTEQIVAPPIIDSAVTGQTLMRTTLSKVLNGAFRGLQSENHRINWHH